MSNLTLRSVKFEHEKKSQNRPVTRIKPSFFAFSEKPFALMNLQRVTVENAQVPCGAHGGGAPPPCASGPGQPTRAQAGGLCTALRVRGLSTP